MSQSVVTIFRSRLRPEAVDEYRDVATRMETLVRDMPGFAAMKTFVCEDGERVTLVEFDSEEAQEAWKLHPEHLQAQKLGREKFYEEFSLIVCRPLRSLSFRNQ